MAKTFSITKNADVHVSVFVDGHEMTEILSYKMEGSPERDTLTLVTEIMDSYDLRIEEPQ